MSNYKTQLEDYVKAIDQINRLHLNANNVYIIHYSCESFKDKALPKIIAIALRNLETGQTHCFSISKCAAIMNIPKEKIEDSYQQIEIQLLNDYFDFLQARQTCTFLHWHMTNDKFGFQAIEYRFKHLGGKPILINDDNKINLARLLTKIFGYENRDKLKIDILAELNYKPRSDYLDGKAEALAFMYKNYDDITASTQLKTLIFATILHKLRTDDLITEIKIKWYQKRFAMKFIKRVLDNPIVSSIITLVSIAVTVLGIYYTILQ
ncbi:MAG: hypothetical protein OEM52_03360 [bacterium]|nr:hypothetical protein [bacterium]